MTQSTETHPVIRYSPRPISEYSRKTAGIETGPPGSAMLRTGAAWNLAYLSHDYDLGPPPSPDFTVMVRRTCQTKLDGSGFDVATEDPSGTVAALLALPAPRFVFLIKSHPVLSALPLYAKYGHSWLDTITKRSYLCQADESPPDNVVDFSAARAFISRL